MKNPLYDARSHWHFIAAVAALGYVCMYVCMYIVHILVLFPWAPKAGDGGGVPRRRKSSDGCPHEIMIFQQPVVCRQILFSKLNN